MLALKFLARAVVFIVVLFFIHFCIWGLGCTDRGQTFRSTDPFADDALLMRDAAVRNVVFQDGAETPEKDGSILPDAIRGFWGKGKSKPGIDGEDTMKWANDTFEALKKKGLTTASDAGSWLTQDFKNMNAWEYKVVFIGDKQPAAAERTLNQLGAEHWECFHVQAQGSSLLFYFKKPKRSFLKSLPTSDLMHLVPLMGGE